MMKLVYAFLAMPAVLMAGLFRSRFLYWCAIDLAVKSDEDFAMGTIVEVMKVTPKMTLDDVPPRYRGKVLLLLMKGA
jgi:hypothetical protein